MEPEVKVEGEPQDKSQEPAVTPEQFAELQDQFKQLQSTNVRLLDESKDNKTKLKAFKDTQEKEGRAKLEEDGNLSELVTELKNEVHGLKVEKRDLKVVSAANALRVEVGKYAKGAINVDDIVRNLDRNLLTLDEETLAYGGVQEAVAKVKEDSPYYWDSKPVTGQIDGRPAKDVPKDKTLEQLIEDDPNSVLNASIRELLK